MVWRVSAWWWKLVFEASVMSNKLRRHRLTPTVPSLVTFLIPARLSVTHILNHPFKDSRTRTSGIWYEECGTRELHRGNSTPKLRTSGVFLDFRGCDSRSYHSRSYLLVQYMI